VGPILFSEAVMIASKVNLINRNTSRIYVEDHLLYSNNQNPVDIVIQKILKLCDDGKRKVNNNLNKLELILLNDNYIEVVKELGKMQRDSWKKDKSKLKCTDLVQEEFPNKTNSHEEQQLEKTKVDSYDNSDDIIDSKTVSDKGSFSYYAK
jgi:hypothetical protein